MRIGVIGLGRMGSNIAVRLTRKGHDVVLHDRTPEVTESTMKRCESGRAENAVTYEDVAKLLEGEDRRIVWIMLPAGKVTEKAIEKMSSLLGEGDIIIDGGNTYYKDDIKRSEYLKKLGIDYVDVGTSGGVWGLDRGYCMMYGCDDATAQYIDPILKSLAPGIGDVAKTQGRKNHSHNPQAEEGYLHCGPAGSGHFVKMIHNGIEYGIMQAYAEGFDVLKSKNSNLLPENERYDMNIADIAEVWRRGSVVSSWLLDLTADALARNGDLTGFSGEVADSGEGRWSIEAAIEEDVPVPVMTAALYARFRSRSGNTFAEKSLSAMRHGFGGHEERKK